MKRGTILLLSMTASWQLAVGQTPPDIIPVPATRLEALAAKKGTLLTAESYYLAGISGENNCHIRLQAIILYEANGQTQQVRGLKVEIGNAGSKNEREIVAYIDIEEMDGLSKAIGSMLDVTRKGAAFPNPLAKELSFSTVGGLTLTMSQRDKERELILTHPLSTNSICSIKRDTAIIELQASIEKALQGFRQP